MENSTSKCGGDERSLGTRAGVANESYRGGQVGDHGELQRERGRSLKCPQLWVSGLCSSHRLEVDSWCLGPLQCIDGCSREGVCYRVGLPADVPHVCGELGNEVQMPGLPRGLLV